MVDKHLSCDALRLYSDFVDATGPLFRTPLIDERGPVPIGPIAAALGVWRCSYCEARVEAARWKCKNCGAARVS
jgi:hypothetical protein